MPGVRIAASRHGTARAYWLGAQEIAHHHASGSVDLRVGRKLIAARHEELRGDRRVKLRSGTSDWLEVTLTSAGDARFAAALLRAGLGDHVENVEHV